MFSFTKLKKLFYIIRMALQNPFILNLSKKLSSQSSGLSDRQELLKLLRQDAFFSNQLNRIPVRNIIVLRSGYGQKAAYKPRVNIGNLSHDLDDFFIKLFITNDLFYNMIVHSFYHELMHVYQDALGLMPYVVHDAKGKLVCLDEQSALKIFLFLESWAEAQALHSVHAYAEKNGHVHWTKARRVAVCKAMHSRYERLKSEGKKTDFEKILALMRLWYEGPQKKKYEQNFMRSYRSFVDQVRKLHKAEPEFVSVSLKAFVESRGNNQNLCDLMQITDWYYFENEASDFKTLNSMRVRVHEQPITLKPASVLYQIAKSEAFNSLGYQSDPAHRFAYSEGIQG